MVKTHKRVSKLSPSKKGPLTQIKKPTVKKASKAGHKPARGTAKGSLTPKLKVNRCKR